MNLMLLIENLSDSNKKINLEIKSKGYITIENSLTYNAVMQLFNIFRF